MTEKLIVNYNLLLYLRLINIILITLTTAAWIIFYRRYKLIMAIAPISWLIHILIYGIFRFTNTPIGNHVVYQHNEFFMDVWTALIITHGLVLLLVSAIESVPPIRQIEEDDKK